MVTKRILVLGASGMLGHIVASYLARLRSPAGTPLYDVTGTCNTVSAPHAQIKFSAELPDTHMRTVLPLNVDAVVNCIGVIRQRRVESLLMYRVNSLFPQRLAKMYRSQCPVIHVSTDCVFSGARGQPYDESFSPDPIDDYGLSKVLGEPIGTFVLRTSIIGQEIERHLGLMDFVRTKQGAELSGYTNHLWNGVTTLQLAKVIEMFVRTVCDRGYGGLWHLHSPEAVTKHQLLVDINEVFRLGNMVKPIEEPNGSVDRRLSSVWRQYNAGIPPIRLQIEELFAWYQEELGRSRD